MTEQFLILFDVILYGMCANVPLFLLWRSSGSANFLGVPSLLVCGADSARVERRLQLGLGQGHTCAFDHRHRLLCIPIIIQGILRSIPISLLPWPLSILDFL